MRSWQVFFFFIIISFRYRAGSDWWALQRCLSMGRGDLGDNGEWVRLRPLFFNWARFSLYLVVPNSLKTTEKRVGMGKTMSWSTGS